MQPLRLSAEIGEFDAIAELAYGDRMARIIINMPGAVRIQRTIDVGQLIAAGISAADALDFTLRAVCVGIESGSLRDL